MPILEMFRLSIFSALTICVCLAAILWCLLLLPRLARGHDRFLVGFIGLIAVYQGLRLLKDAGVWKMPGSASLESFATFVVCSLYLVALFVLQIFGAEHRTAKVCLRLAEANQLPVTAARTAQAEEARPDSDSSKPRISGANDSAFAPTK